MSAAALAFGAGAATPGYGPVRPDPGGLVELPSGFQYRIISPEGRTFFVNIQNPGITLAIWGPFRYRNTTRQARMSVAAPPEEFAPQLSGELTEAARKYGMGDLQAAAFDRLGVPLA